MFTYNPKQVSVVFGGIPLSGFAEDSLVEAERDKEAYTKQVSADGPVTRTRVVDIAGKVTVHLMQTSASNDYLTSLAILDEASDAGVRPLTVRDASGRTLISCAAAWVQKLPKTDLTVKAEKRTWILDCAEMPVFLPLGN